MRKIFILLFTFISLVFGNSSVEKFEWPQGVSFLQFLESVQIPLSVYYDLDKEGQELAAEVISGATCYMLKDGSGKISQLLIPISEELQIQIYKDKSNSYKLDFTPIIYTQNYYELGIEINNSLYIDIINATGNAALANEFMLVFKNEVNFKKLQKGDKLVILYEQKERLGRPFGGIKIISGMIQENKKSKYLYFFDDKHYNSEGKKTESFLLTTPVVYTRIASKFTPKRFHPILKRYRAHLGVDYSAPKGTKVNAAGGGKVTFVGRKNGYGNTIEITHGGGIMTLYAHLNGFAKGMKQGISVKQGDLIGYVGNTGLSSGPHLHFGVYKNKQAVDPLKVVKIEKTNFVSAEELAFKAFVKEQNDKIKAAMNGEKNPVKFENFESSVMLN